jgi:hypothetical protein
MLYAIEKRKATSRSSTFNFACSSQKLKELSLPHHHPNNSKKLDSKQKKHYI